MKLTEIPSSSIDLSSLRLARGSHVSRDDGMCLMEAVAYVAGEPHSDEPACACPVLAAFGRAWNDALDDADRQRLLAPFVPRLVGTRSTPEVEERRAYMALDWLIRVHTPAWLDLRPEFGEHAAALRALPAIVDLASAEHAGETVRAAARADAGAVLRPTVERLQASAVELLDRMIAVQPEVTRV